MDIGAPREALLAQDDGSVEKSVIRVPVGGPQAWHPLERSLIVQLLEKGATDGQIDQICVAFERIHMKWCPARAILINEEDRHLLVPMVEDLTSMARVTTNGLFFELLKREIERLQQKTA